MRPRFRRQVLFFIQKYLSYENLLNSIKYLGTLGVCLAFGFAVAFGVYASAGVSGGHINPAVTMAMFTLGKLGKIG